ncbi:MAG: hypothetical protein GXP27_08750 [Planctomycetes bacterium]|nr:hypothetical protein [Planctomycetota bacterium]
MPKGKSEAEYPLTATGNARIQKWPVFVLGTANENGAVWVSSQMVTLEVAEPYVTFAMQRAAVEQGQQTEIVCQVTHHRPFEGQAKVKLLGLPAKATTVELELTHDTQELVFPVKTAKDTPAGNHKNIFCQVVIVQNGEPITHSRVGGTELRVDKPLPPKTKAPAQPKPVAKRPAKKQPAKPVRLSRLQQLRLQAQKERQASASPGSK